MHYIKGAGMTKFGIHNKTSQELCYEAVTEALENVDMSLAEIDEIIIAKGDSLNDGERQRMFQGVLSSILQKEGIPKNYREYIKNYFISIGLHSEDHRHGNQQ